MKTISVLLALVNSLFAGLIIAYSLSGSEIRDAATGWLLTKILAALFVIAVGGLTWMGSGGRVGPGLMSLSSLCLAALGVATVIWTFRLGVVTGDMEYYMVAYGGSLILQGMTWWAARLPTASGAAS
ncbi:MAG: hypothetical protein HND47_08720 [Chloroflexi bacterium]|nr:hypothetical protein [Chloroflexota bacterium]